MHDSKRKRRAFLTAELVLTLPVLGLILFALFEFSMLFSSRASVQDAARAGARRATMSGAQAADVENEIRVKLPERFRKDADIRIQPGQHTGDVVTVSVTVPMNAAAPDLLWPIGYRLRGRTLVAETKMVKE